MSPSPIPCQEAYPLDQGKSKTCTYHAIANAVADQLHERRYEIDQDILAQMLVASNQIIGPVWPHFFDNYSIPWKLINESNPEWISIKMFVKEVEIFSNMEKHVLAYHTSCERTSQDYHCVFVKKQQGNYYYCVNSWGDNNPYPEIEVNKSGNRLWRVKAEVEAPEKGWSFVAYRF